MRVEFCRWGHVRDSQRASGIQENVDPTQRNTKAESGYAEEYARLRRTTTILNYRKLVVPISHDRSLSDEEASGLKKKNIEWIPSNRQECVIRWKIIAIR